MREKSELIVHLKEELNHVHGDIEHGQCDIEARVSHLKNPDEHMHHLIGETERSEVNISPL